MPRTLLPILNRPCRIFRVTDMKFTLLAAIAIAVASHTGNCTTLPTTDIHADTTKRKALKIKPMDRSELIAPADGTLERSALKKESPAKPATKKDTAEKPLPRGREKAEKDSVAHKEHNSGIHATYPGGDVAIMRYVRAHMRYPQECKSQRLTGRVEVAMTIAPEGEIKEVKLHSCSGNKYMDAEAMRVAKTMTQWEPAEDVANGKELEYIVTFVFRPGR